MSRIEMDGGPKVHTHSFKLNSFPGKTKLISSSIAEKNPCRFIIHLSYKGIYSCSRCCSVQITVGWYQTCQATRYQDVKHVANVNLLPLFVIHHYFYLTGNISSYINTVNKFHIPLLGKKNSAAGRWRKLIWANSKPSQACPCGHEASQLTAVGVNLMKVKKIFFFYLLRMDQADSDCSLADCLPHACTMRSAGMRNRDSSI